MKKIYLKTILKKSLLASFATLVLAGSSNAQAFTVRGTGTAISSTAANAYNSMVVLVENGLNVPYIAYTESGNAAAGATVAGGPLMIKKNTGGTTWVSVGTTGITNASYVNLKADNNGKLYLSFMYQDAANSITNRLGVMTYNTRATSPAWTFVGTNPVSESGIHTGQSAGNLAYNNALTIDASGRPFIFYCNLPTTTTTTGPVAKYFDGTNWVTLGGGAVNASDRGNNPDIKVVNDTTYVQYHTGNTTGQLKAFSIPNNVTGATWTDLAIPTSITLDRTGATLTTARSTTAANFDRLAAYRNPTGGTRLYVTYGADQLGIVYETKAPADSWRLLGTGTLGTAAAAYASTLTDDQGDIYLITRSFHTVQTARLFEYSYSANAWTEFLGGAAGPGFDNNNIQYYTNIARGTNSLFIAYSQGATGAITPTVQEVTGVILPVSLLSFTAQASGQNVLLKWTTASEVNSNKYVIEKSLDGNRFESLTEVKSKGPSAYAVVDEHPVAGLNYYRLLQYDKDGAKKVFNTVVVKFSGAKAITVYPNPTAQSIAFNTESITGKVSIALTDNQGRIVYQETTANINAGVYTLGLKQSLPAGNYQLIVISNSGRQVASVVVDK